MTGISSIALIGFGEVGQILAADLAKAGVADIAAYDIQFCDVTSAPARASSPARRCSSAAEAVTGRDLVISAVTAASDGDAAQSAAVAIHRDAFFLDVNSVSPNQKQAAAEIVNSAGGRYVEAAVMAPIAPRRIASAMLLGGPHAAAFAAAAVPLGFSGARVFSADYGKASATKMCRSVMIKGVEALLMESLLTARHYGVEAPVLSSLSDLLPVGDWNGLAAYMISRALEHGTRRAEEMREVAKTVAQAGIDPLMSQACAVRQDWASSHKTALGPDLAETLDAILTSIGNAAAIKKKTGLSA